MRAHYAALKDRMLSDPAVKVSDAARVDTTGALIRDTYAVLYGSTGDRNDDRLTAPQSPDADVDFVYSIRAVSITADGVLLLMSKLYTLLAGHVLTIAGRTCNPITLDDNGATVQPI